MRRFSPILAAVVTGVASAGAFAQTPRAIDGFGNNMTFGEYGAVGIQLLRTTTVDYGDLFSTPAGADRPSAREISNDVCAQVGSIPNVAGASAFLFQWGQFVDHDIDLTVGASPSEPFNILVPSDDLFFTPNSEIPLNRSDYDSATGTSSPRQQTNGISAFIDASNVYGSDSYRANFLRTLDGTGRLKTSRHNLLPFNTIGLANAGGPDPSLFIAGDVRANETIGLTAVHTLMVREHNRIVGVLREEDELLSGDDLYERARAIVGAELQVITYREFLPVLLGPDALTLYSGYNPTVDPGISNVFSTAAYRFGHSQLSPTLLRLKRNGDTIPQGDLALRDAFFAPSLLLPSNGEGIEPLLRGLATQVSQAVDAFVVDDVRNFLFGPPEAGGFDLPALNIQRGRDHGLPSYNQTRLDMGLSAAGTFADISSDPVVVTRLQVAYATVDDVDVWVGGIAEDHFPGALVGELFYVIIKDQFERLRDGDRYWYENVFTYEEIGELESTTLSDIIKQNTKIRKELQDNVFLVAS